MTEPVRGGDAPAVPSALPIVWSVRYLVVWLVLVGIWEFLVRVGVWRGLLLPAPSVIAGALVQLITDGTLEVHLLFTAIRIAVGLLVGGTIGAGLGLAMGISRRLRRFTDPIVAALHPIPRLAFFPLLIAMLGVGEMSKLAAVAIGAFFPMLLNTIAGVRGMNPVHVELARNFGATRRQLFGRVLLPGSLPLMLTGLRLSTNVAFHGTIGVEMVGSQTGLGSMLWLSWQTFRIDQLYAILIVIAAVGIGLATFIRWVTSRTAPWLAERAPSA
jgi:ABC-type nitrate/sulfonate/bicarbonate transport system permease component